MGYVAETMGVLTLRAWRVYPEAQEEGADSAWVKMQRGRERERVERVTVRCWLKVQANSGKEFVVPKTI